jgi:hypothetical protein
MALHEPAIQTIVGDIDRLPGPGVTERPKMDFREWIESIGGRPRPRLGSELAKPLPVTVSCSGIGQTHATSGPSQCREESSAIHGGDSVGSTKDVGVSSNQQGEIYWSRSGGACETALRAVRARGTSDVAARRRSEEAGEERAKRVVVVTPQKKKESVRTEALRLPMRTPVVTLFELRADLV